MRKICLVTIFCLACSFSARAETRSRIFSVLLETTETETFGITDDAYRHRAKLTGCGYEVVGIEPRDLDQLERELRRRAPLGPNETFLVEGHGEVRGGALLLQGRPPGSPQVEKLFSAADFLATIARHSQRASVHLDVCHAGAATLDIPQPPPGLGLSLPTADDDLSFSHNPSSELMVDLLCSANPERGDCVLWRQVDRNRDGIISEAEFTAHQRQVSRFSAPLDLYVQRFFSDDVDDIRLFREQCEKDGGNVNLRDSEVLVRVRYRDSSGRHEVGASEFRGIVRNNPDPSGDWRPSLEAEQDYHRTYLAELNRGRFSSIEYFVARSRSSYHCQRTDGKLSYQQRASVRPGHSASIHFVNTVLQSAHCTGPAAPQGSSGRSGLAGLEEAGRQRIGFH